MLSQEVEPEDAPTSSVFVGGWGEASLQGQSTPTGRSFRPVRACVRVVLFMSNQGGRPPSLFPFAPEGISISLFPSGFVSWSLSEQV